MNDWIWMSNFNIMWWKSIFILYIHFVLSFHCFNKIKFKPVFIIQIKLYQVSIASFKKVTIVTRTATSSASRAKKKNIFSGRKCYFWYTHFLLFWAAFEHASSQLQMTLFQAAFFTSFFSVIQKWIVFGLCHQLFSSRLTGRRRLIFGF